MHVTRFALTLLLCSASIWLGCRPDYSGRAKPNSDASLVSEAEGKSSEVTKNEEVAAKPSAPDRASTKTKKQTADSSDEDVILNRPTSPLDESNNKTITAADSSKKFSASVLSWNIESEGNDPATIAKELAELAVGKYDIVGLTEVHPDNFRLYGAAMGDSYRWAQTISGFNDRMMILYDTNKYDRVRRFELNEINFENRYRSPLVVHLKDKKSKTEFLVVINHLARGKAEIRQQQAQKLVDWARTQNLPVIAIGDYNFDFVFETESGNEAFRIFLRDGIYRWIRPEPLIDSNWYDPEGDGIDNYPGSILDFCFVAGSAKSWRATSRVIVRDGDFPDDDKTSDHRPLELLLSN